VTLASLIVVGAASGAVLASRREGADPVGAVGTVGLSIASVVVAGLALGDMLGSVGRVSGVGVGLVVTAMWSHRDLRERRMPRAPRIAGR